MHLISVQKPVEVIFNYLSGKLPSFQKNIVIENIDEKNLTINGRIIDSDAEISKSLSTHLNINIIKDDEDTSVIRIYTYIPKFLKDFCIVAQLFLLLCLIIVLIKVGLSNPFWVILVFGLIAIELDVLQKSWIMSKVEDSIVNDLSKEFKSDDENVVFLKGYESPLPLTYYNSIFYLIGFLMIVTFMIQSINILLLLGVILIFGRINLTEYRAKKNFSSKSIFLLNHKISFMSLFYAQFGITIIFLFLIINIDFNELPSLMKVPLTIFLLVFFLFMIITIIFIPALQLFLDRKYFKDIPIDIPDIHETVEIPENFKKRIIILWGLTFSVTIILFILFLSMILSFIIGENIFTGLGMDIINGLLNFSNIIFENIYSVYSITFFFIILLFLPFFLFIIYSFKDIIRINGIFSYTNTYINKKEYKFFEKKINDLYRNYNKSRNKNFKIKLLISKSENIELKTYNFIFLNNYAIIEMSNKLYNNLSKDISSNENLIKSLFAHEIGHIVLHLREMKLLRFLSYITFFGQNTLGLMLDLKKMEFEADEFACKLIDPLEYRNSLVIQQSLGINKKDENINNYINADIENIKLAIKDSYAMFYEKRILVYFYPTYRERNVNIYMKNLNKTIT